MSLLNQVLQDLQDRQAPDAGNAQATLRDVRVPVRGATRATRATQRPWVLWSAIIILAGVSGNLLWQRGQHTAVAPVSSAPPPTAAVVAHASPQPTVAPRVPEFAPAKAPAIMPALNNTSPAITASAPQSIATAHAPVATPEPRPTPAPQVHVAERAPTTAPVNTTPEAPAPATLQKAAAAITPPSRKFAATPQANAVEKTARPLNPEQQAELSYQDAQRLLQSGRPSAAEPRLRAALDGYPAHRAARMALAGLLINAGRLPEAGTVLAAGLALAPTDAAYAKLYARLRIDQGELADARAVLERAAPPVQDDAEYHALLAALYQRLGLFAQAAQTYRGALQVQPRNGVWWLGLGLALEGANDRSNALQAYQRAQQSGTLDSEVLRYVDSKITALQ